MNAIPDIFWLKDTKGIFLSCNKRFEQLCGTTEKDKIGKTDYDLVDKEIVHKSENLDSVSRITWTL